MSDMQLPTEEHYSSSIAQADDLRVVDALRRGDEAIFVSLVEQYQATMLRIAMHYVSSTSVAEEVVQDTWLGMLQSIQRFEGRSSFKTWLFRILTNRAKTRGEREGRTVPFAVFVNDANEQEPSLEPEYFYPADHPQRAHGWVSYPQRWPEPEQQALSQELYALIKQTISTLPPSQREVITLRDVESWSAGDVCNVLQISESNQRVLLHRARTKVRNALAPYMTGT